MQCWSPLLHGSCFHLLHCCYPAFHERNLHQCCCCQAVGPTGSLSCVLAPLFGLIWDGDAAAVEYDCHVERRVGLQPKRSEESKLYRFSPVSYGRYYHCYLFRQHFSPYQLHFLSGIGDDAEQLLRSRLPWPKRKRRKSKKRAKVGGLEEKHLTSSLRRQLPCHGYSLACVDGEQSEPAVGGGRDDGGDESCFQQGGYQLDHCDHSEGAELPISGPAEIPWAPHPGGQSREADCPFQPPSAVVGGEAFSHPGQGSCCSCLVHPYSDAGDGCYPGVQLECRLAVESDWMSRCWG